MKKYRIIESLLKEPIKSMTVNPVGLTNTIWDVTTQHHHVVLREPKKENDGLFDYQVEAHIIDLIQPLEIDVPTVYFDAQSGIKITKYVPNAEMFEPKYARRAAQLLKKLHHAQLKVGHSFQLRTQFLLFETPDPKYALNYHLAYLTQLDEDTKDARTLCHNDCVAGNFLFTKTQDYLIDYEYAKDNHPFFDLMSLITENNLNDPNIRAHIYDTYFERQPTKQEQQLLDRFEKAHHILWCQWACMMFAKFNDPVYEAIADDKYTQLQQLLATHK